MKPLIVVLAVFTLLAHLWFSSRRHAGPNELILTEAVQPGISENFDGIAIQYQYLDGFLEGNVPNIATRLAAEEQARKLRPAGRIFNNLTVKDMAGYLKDSPRVLAKFSGGKLLLDGIVPTLEISSKIQEAASKMNIGEVENRLKVKPGIARASWLNQFDVFMGDFFPGATSGQIEADSRSIRVQRNPFSGAAKNNLLAKARKLGPPVVEEGEQKAVEPAAEFEFGMRRDGKNLHLSGWLPDESTKKRVVGATGVKFPDLTVLDGIDLSPNVKMPEWGFRLPDFIENMDEDFSGDLRFNKKGIMISGVTDAARSKLESLGSGFFAGKLPIPPPVIPKVELPKAPPVEVNKHAEVLAVLDKGTLTLTGKVQNQDMKRAIERSVAAALGGGKINNKLVVDITLVAPSWGEGLPSLLRDFFSTNANNAELEINKEMLRMKQRLPGQPLKDTYLSMAGALYPDGKLIDEMSVVKPPVKPVKVTPTKAAKLKAFLSSPRIQLDGELPDNESRNHVVRGATKSFPKAKLQDNIEISPEVKPAPWLRGFGDFLGDFSSLAKEGEITVGEDEVAITGDAAGDINHNRLLARLSKVMPKDIQIQDQMKEGTPVPGSDPAEDFPSFVVYYATGSSQINKEGVAQVKDAVNTAAKIGSDATVLVKGFADSRGDPEANKKLSEKRAQGVVDSLAAQGVQRSAIRYIGVGESESKGGANQNDRRVEVILVP
ncbi:MAG: OmpA family protein [Verrucomicrobiales bacterium]|nr:OmpA family protein [Verrucomicrobiales bacterium]